MGKIIHWLTSEYPGNDLLERPNYLFFAENVVRYKHFVSPCSIKFCIQDSVPYIVDNEKISIMPGSFMIANDGLEMECLPCNPAVKAMAVFFSNELLQDVYRSRSSDEFRLLDQPEARHEPIRFFQNIYRHPNRLSEQIRVLATHMANATESSNDIGLDLFYNLAESMFSLQADISRQINRVNARSAATREELFRRVWQAKDFMHDSWRSELNLNTIAQKACLSPYHFHRSFQEAFGQSPMKWFRLLKLKNAKSLLGSGQMNVTQVALYCGFGDVFSFSKAFKREFGISPSEIEKTVLSKRCSPTQRRR